MITENDQTDDTRQRILKVALELFAKHGFDGVSIREITELASCNLASMNYYFGTKKNLYDECLSSVEPVTNSRLSQILKTPVNRVEFEQSFIKFCEVVIEAVMENSSSLKLLITEINSQTTTQIRDSFLKPLTDSFESYLIEAQKNKVVSLKINASIFTQMVVAVIVSQKLYRSFQPFDKIPDDAFTIKIVETCTSNFYV